MVVVAAAILLVRNLLWRLDGKSKEQKKVDRKKENGKLNVKCHQRQPAALVVVKASAHETVSGVDNG